MISFSSIHKQYGKQLIFVDASFQLNPGEKVGLVGPNGSGKTTLFRMVVGEEAPDEGEVSVPKKLTVGYFRQDVEEMKGRSTLDEAIAGSGRLGDLHHELGKPAQGNGRSRPGRRYGPDSRPLRRRAGGVRAPGRLLARSAGARGAARPRLSGRSDRRRRRRAPRAAGRLRVALARVLLGRPDALLMDEPTNHPGHRIDHLARTIPEVLPGRAADDLAR